MRDLDSLLLPVRLAGNVLGLLTGPMAIAENQIEEVTEDQYEPEPDQNCDDIEEDIYLQRELGCAWQQHFQEAWHESV